MSEDEGTANPEVTIALAVEHVEHDQLLHDMLSLLVHQYNLFGEIVPEIHALVPDVRLWRLTLTGDISATVNTLEGREKAKGYTTDRGAGHVGGVTLPREDGTFDIVLGAELLVGPPGDHEDLDGLVENALATGRHLARHEAGHALLRLRGEDADAYRDRPSLTPSAAGWTDVVAAYMDDFRIERHTREHAPPVFSHLDGVEGAIEHLSSELTTAKESWRTDLDGAARRSDLAVSGFIRVIAYLAAELGVNENEHPVGPESDPEKWDRYLGTAWPAWSAAFHKLRPVDEPMDLDALSVVLDELCDLASAWSGAIGYERGVTDDGRMYAFWTEDTY